jgi:O-antigen/teichoic acid export membrane protein
MKQKIIHIVKHPLFSGSAVMVIGTNLNNVINYIYHVFMGRMLGPVAYGEMASLFSLIVLVGTVPASINLAVVKYVSSMKNKQELSGFLSWIMKKSVILGIVISLIALGFSKYLQEFLKIRSLLPVIILSASFAILIPSTILRSILQGLLKFNKLIATYLTENIFKLIISITFVLLGLSVSGSMLGILIASGIGIGLSYIFSSAYLKNAHSNPVGLSKFIEYSFPVLLYSVASTSLFSSDLLLVKHFFSAQEAGTYAALSTMGKIIVFGASPVTGVMFPLVSKRKSDGENFHKIFWFGFLLIGFICVLMLTVYKTIPEFAVSLLYGNQYLYAAKLLFPFGLFIAFFTLVTYLVGFYLSVNHTKIVTILAGAAILQIIGIILFHTSLLEVITVSTVVTFACLILLLALLKGKLVKITL